MSYELYFLNSNISDSDFLSYFSKRPNYKVKNSQAFYNNELTEIYFSFEYLNKKKWIFKKDEYNCLTNTILFNINYNRPHVFALEAIIEIESFIKYFTFEIFDPQIGEHSRGSFNRQKFMLCWNKGNKSAIKSILSSNKNENQKVYLMSTSEIEKMWHWNYERDNRYDILKKHIFIPRYMYIIINEKLYTMLVWTDGIPVLMPKADFILLMKDELAQNKPQGSSFEKCLLTFKEVELILKKFSKSTIFDLEAYELFYDNNHPVVDHFFKNAKSNLEYTRISLSEVINEEYLISS